MDAHSTPPNHSRLLRNQMRAPRLRKARHGNELPCWAFSRCQRWGNKWGNRCDFVTSPDATLANLSRLADHSQQSFRVGLLITREQGLRVTPPTGLCDVYHRQVLPLGCPPAAIGVPCAAG